MHEVSPRRCYPVLATFHLILGFLVILKGYLSSFFPLAIGTWLIILGITLWRLSHKLCIVALITHLFWIAFSLYTFTVVLKIIVMGGDIGVAGAAVLAKVILFFPIITALSIATVIRLSRKKSNEVVQRQL